MQFHFDDGVPDQKLKLDALLAAKHDAGMHLYICGPMGFMDWVLGTARAAGWPNAQLHFEFFGAAPDQSESDASTGSLN